MASGAFTLKATGSGFNRGATIQWNGSPRPTTFISDTQLTSIIPAEDLLVGGTFTVQVMNPGDSAAALGIPFKITLPRTIDLTWDESRKVIYLAVPRIGSTPGSLLAYDPATGRVTGSLILDAEPGLLALSGGGQYLYASFRDSSSIRRYRLPTFALDQTIALGADPDSGPFVALDMKVAPGAPRTLAVVRGKLGGSPLGTGGVVIYDDLVRRPLNSLDESVFGMTTDRIHWSPDGSRIFAEEMRVYPGGSQVLAVTPEGPMPILSFPGIIPSTNVDCHFEAATGLLYFNSGLVVDPQTGQVAGTFTYPGTGIGNFGLAVTTDASTGKAFFLAPGTGSLDTQVRSFDLVRGTSLGAIPAGSDWMPTRLVRWGPDGLASGGGGTTLWTYAGNFVSGVASASPILEGLTPSSCLAGAGEIVLEVTGAGFAQASTLRWNGVDRPTTFVSATLLRAAIPASDLTTPGVAAVTVANSAASGGGSNEVSFPVVELQGTCVPIRTNGLVWDAGRQLFYASVPGCSAVHGNCLVTVDPATSNIVKSVYAGSEPGVVALADDGSFLYVTLDGESAIARFRLPDLVQDLRIPLGTNNRFVPYMAMDIQVAPGAPRTIAAALGRLYDRSTTPADAIAVFDDATPRPNRLISQINGVEATALHWGQDAGTLFGINGETSGFNLYTIGVDAQGLSLVRNTRDAARFFWDRLHLDAPTNRLYTDLGSVLDAATGVRLGTFPVGGRVVLDSATRRAFFIGHDEAWRLGLAVADMDAFTLLRDTTLSTEPPNDRVPTRIFRWGADGLAAGGGGSILMLLRGPFISR